MRVKEKEGKSEGGKKKIEGKKECKKKGWRKK